MTTVKQLTKRYNEMTGKNIKVGSYTKPQLMKMMTTKLPEGKAMGVDKRNAPHTTKHLRDRKKTSTRVATKRPIETNDKIIRTIDLAEQYKMSAKTLRARIRRDIEKWAPLFKDGIKHVFPNNKTTLDKINALMS